MNYTRFKRLERHHKSSVIENGETWLSFKGFDSLYLCRTFATESFIMTIFIFSPYLNLLFCCSRTFQIQNILQSWHSFHISLCHSNSFNGQCVSYFLNWYFYLSQVRVNSRSCLINIKKICYLMSCSFIAIVQCVT